MPTPTNLTALPCYREPPSEDPYGFHLHTLMAMCWLACRSGDPESAMIAGDSIVHMARLRNPPEIWDVESAHSELLELIEGGKSQHNALSPTP